MLMKERCVASCQCIGVIIEMRKWRIQTVWRFCIFQRHFFFTTMHPPPPQLGELSFLQAQRGEGTTFIDQIYIYFIFQSKLCPQGATGEQIQMYTYINKTKRDLREVITQYILVKINIPIRFKIDGSSEQCCNFYRTNKRQCNFCCKLTTILKKS